MTTEQYLRTLKKLGLTPHGKATREVLGLSARQLARLANGKLKPTPMLARLLACLVSRLDR